MRCSSVRRKWYARPKPLPSSRPTYPLSIRALSASRVARTRSRSSTRPCTSCSSWTENSTSRSPPAPSLISRPASRAGMCAITRLRMAWVSETKFSRSAARQTIGATMSDEVLGQSQVAGARVGP